MNWKKAVEKAKRKMEKLKANKNIIFLTSSNQLPYSYYRKIGKLKGKFFSK